MGNPIKKIPLNHIEDGDLLLEHDDELYLKGAWVPKTINWNNGYFVDLNGVVSGGGTNTLYRMSDLISVNEAEQYHAYLRAGNLLAISGWTNGTYNSDLAVVGLDTNNGRDYYFSIPSGVTHIRLTCRVELTNPTLMVFDEEDGSEKVSKIDSINQRLNYLYSLSGYETDIIAEISQFTGNKNLSGNASLSTGLTYQKNIAFDNLDFIAKIKVTTAGIFGLSRNNTSGYGTAMVVNGSNLEIRRLSSSGAGVTIYTFPLGFSITAGKTYLLRMFKNAKDLNVSIISEDGDFFKKSILYDSVSYDFGRGWGFPTIFCYTGAIEVIIANLIKDSDIRGQFLHFGDSLVEGWGIITNQPLRYGSLFKDLVSRNSQISGRGGDTTSSLLARVETEIRMSSNIKYVILDIGTNDTNLATFQSNLSSLITAVKNLSKTPILVTVTPKSGTPVVNINSYIRGLGELYIDKNKAINNGSETAWNSSYVNADNVHPNVLGNRRIFNRMLFDLSVFYSTIDLFKTKTFEFSTTTSTDNAVFDITNAGFVDLNSLKFNVSTELIGSATSNAPFGVVSEKSLTSVTVSLYDSKTTIVVDGGTVDGLESHSEANTVVYLTVKGN